MNRRIISFEPDGKPALGFDTGLDARSFAQAKMALFVNQPGFIVYPGGSVEIWQPGGITECVSKDSVIQDKKNIILWGPYFPGEEMEEIINEPERKDEALDALRFWIRARMFLEKRLESEKKPPLSGPSGVLIVTKKNAAQGNKYPEGAIFFPPARLLRRCFETEDAEGISFSAGAMLYRIFSGIAPFSHDGVFVPPDLAAPGLDPEMSNLITQALRPEALLKEVKPRPAPDFICGFLAPPFSKPVSAWIKPLDENEKTRILTERGQYTKKKTRAIKRRKILISNATLIFAFVIACIFLSFAVWEYIRHRSELPSTEGMAPFEVAETYYAAFNALDHAVMQACVTGGAGKEDIEMASNLFVIGRVRQAYENSRGKVLSAQEWLENGRPALEQIIFGITNLKITVISEGAGNASLEASYILWTSATGFEEEKKPISLTSGLSTKDILNLVTIKDAWRIADIERTKLP